MFQALSLLLGGTVGTTVVVVDIEVAVACDIGSSSWTHHDSGGGGGTCVTISLNYFYFLHVLTSCYMRLPHVVYFYFDHAVTML